MENKQQIEIQITRLFRSIRRFEKLSNIKAPQFILDNEINLKDRITHQLKKLNFNPIPFLNSIQGKIEYLDFCTREDQIDKIEKNCQDCINQFYSTKGFVCSIHDDIPLDCKLKSQSNQHHQNLVETRCTTAQNAQIT